MLAGRAVTLSLLGFGCSEAALKTFNAEPTATILSHADGDTPLTDDETVLFGAVADPDHGPTDLITVWRVDGEIVCEDIVPALDGYTNCVTPLNPGDHTIVLSVRDPKNASGSDSVTVSVQSPTPNTPPEITLTDPFEGQRYWADEPVEFRGRALDAEDGFDALVVTAESDTQGPLSLDGSLDVDGLFSDFVTLDEGMHLITVTVTDSDGESADDQALIEVLPSNQAPSIDGVTVTPDPATVTDELVCAYTGYLDPDGDGDESRIAWTINEATVTASGATLSGGFAAGDTVRCTVTPSDGEMDGPSLYDEVVVVNSPPRLSSALISPNPAVAGDSLVCTHDGFEDADGDLDASEAEWTVNGSTVGTGSALTTAVVGGDVVECTVTPFDGVDAGEPVSDSLVVQNTAPTVTMVTISPSTGVTATTLLNCTATAEDADGTDPTVTFAWSIAGYSVGIGPDLDLGPMATVRGETVMCTATATDGEGASHTATASVVVGNTAPEVSTITLSPSPARTNDTLTAASTTSDADEDPVSVTHQWWVNGEMVVEAGPELDGSIHFAKHDLVEVEATPFDGTDWGEPLRSDVVSIANTPPTAPTARIEAAEADCHSMDFDGVDDAVTVGPLGTGGRWTFEAWIQWDPSEPGTLFWNECFAIATFSTRSTFYLVQDDECDGNTDYFIDGSIDASPLSDGAWHHLAVTYDGTFEAFIDGTSMGRSTPTFDSHSSGPYPGGLAAQTGHSYGDARVHAVRVSDDVRYTEDFTPLRRFETDATTALLWNLSEPGVSVVPDESGAGHDGTVEGGTWVEDCPAAARVEALVCSVDTPSADDDDDSVSYRAAWFVDGAPYADTEATLWPDDTVPGDALGYDETWTCELTPNDGEEDGSPSSAEWVTGSEPEEPVPPPEDDTGPTDGLDGEIDPTIEADHDAVFPALAVTPDGSRVYATRTFRDDIIAVSADDLSFIASIDVGGEPADVEVSPDGNRAYVAVNTSPGRTVVVDIDPTSATYHSVLHTLILGGNGSRGVGVHPDGSRVLAVTQNPGAGTVFEILTEGHSLARTLTPPAAGTAPSLQDIAFSPDGTTAYASIFQSAGANNVVAISMDSFSVDAAIDLMLPSMGGGPGNIAVTNSSAGPRLWVANNSWEDDGLTVVDMDTNTVVVHEELGTFAGRIPGLCATPDGNTVLMAHDGLPIRFYDASTVEVFHEHAERSDHYTCVVAPDSAAFFVATASGSIIRIDMDRVLDSESAPEPPVETTGDVTAESGLVYSASECLFCPEEDWYAAFKAFDDNTGTSASGWYTPWTGSPQWVQVDFGEGNEKAIRHYGLMGATFSASYSARDWQLMASPDGVEWTVMHEVFGASLAYVMWGGEPFTRYSFSNDTALRYWRLLVTGNAGGGEMGIVEIELMENL